MIDRALTALGRAGDGLHSMRLLQQTPHKLTLLAERAGQRFVLRIDLPDGAVPGLSRPAELAVLHWAAAAGLGPIVAASAPGVLLLHYLDGRSWTADDLRDPQQLVRAGRLLRRLHDAGRNGRVAHSRRSEFIRDSSSAVADPAANKSSRMNSLLPGAGMPLPHLIHAYATHIDTAEARDAAAEILRLLPAPDPATTTLCHRDPTAPNWLETPDGQLLLIDWEYAGPGDPLYDLAVIIEHHALGEDLAETLLASWSGSPSTAERERLARLRQAYQRVAFLWERVQPRMSSSPVRG